MKKNNSHTELGKRGEEMAFAYLRRKGLKIVACNWRYQHLEIDIIAQDKDVLVFVEVKTRRTAYFGSPEEAVSSQKIAHLFNAAEAYIFENNYQGESRFDVVSIILPPGKKPELEYFEDAFSA